jgi:hypothetical protein
MPAGSCSNGARQIAERAVADFHDHYSAKQFSTLFNGAHRDFKRSGTCGNFNSLMHSVYANLGKVASTRNQYLKISGDEGERLLLQQKTTFEKGIGFETFLFTIEEGEAVLAGYKINSQQLNAL